MRCRSSMLPLMGWIAISVLGSELWGQDQESDKKSEKLTPAVVYPKDGDIKSDEHGDFQFASTRQPPAVQPVPSLGVQPVPSLGVQPVPSPAISSGLGGFGTWMDEEVQNLLQADRPGEFTAASSGMVQTPVARAITMDSTELLRQSGSIQTVQAQRRSPVSFNPLVRGFKYGQVYTQADGSQFLPVREDLDTILSKIDPSEIQDVVVVPGPYSAVYGPGLSFIDILTAPTPRFDGFQTYGRTGVSYRTNGGQVYGRQSVFGGADNWGFRFGYGNRIGSDYRAGNSVEIPASYHNQDYRGAFGYSINPDQRVEFNYNRMDQTNAEYPGQFFDVDFLGVDAYNLQLIDEDPFHPWTKLTAYGWYNYTRFDGDTLNESKRTFGVIPRIEAALGFPGGPDLLGSSTFFGFTEGDLTSTGGRVITTFGDIGDPRLSLGADFRHRAQGIGERFIGLTTLGDDPTIDISTNLPSATYDNPGLLAELALPTSTYWDTTLGARVDWVNTNADPNLVGADNALFFRTRDFEQNDTLYAFYLTNELELSDGVTGVVSAGHGQRPPSLLERYSNGVFIGMFQSGLTRVIGDPTLDKERNWQIDLGLRANQQYFRGSASVFHSWVNDYITYRANRVGNPVDSRLLLAMNTPLATISGCELAGEWDLADRLTFFSSGTYLDGRDQIIDAPLPMIYPLQGRFGLRLHDPDGGQYWGLEFAARVVDNQDRLGTLRDGFSETSTALVEQETAGFTVYYLRGYYNVVESELSRLSLVGGIDNLFDKTYIEHLDLRLQGDATFPQQLVLSPGFTPFIGVEYTY